MEGFVRIKSKFPEVKDYYYINEYGQVYSQKTHKFLKRNLKKGYATYNLTTDSKRNYQTISEHRLVGEFFVKGKTEDKNQINHIDGNKLNNYKNNLEWVSAKENINHAVKTGLTTFDTISGENSCYNKYSKKVIQKVINLLLEQKYSDKEIEKQTGVPYKNIGHIRRKETWKKMTEKYSIEDLTRKNKK